MRYWGILFWLCCSVWAQRTQELKGHITNDMEEVFMYQLSLLNENKKLLQGKNFYTAEFQLQLSEDVSFIQFSSLGYQDVIFPVETLQDELIVTLHTQLLDEVVVMEQRPNFALENGNLAVDVANSPTLSQSNNAEEVLGKLPRLRIISGESVEMVGKGKVGVLLNGQPSTAEVVFEIPSENIAKIELIENPPAKYSAIDKSPVLLNVITKQPTDVSGHQVTIGMRNQILSYYSGAIRTKWNATWNRAWRSEVAYLYAIRDKLYTEKLIFEDERDPNRSQETNSTNRLRSYNDHVVNLKLDFIPNAIHQWNTKYNFIVRDFTRTNQTTQTDALQQVTDRSQQQAIRRFVHNFNTQYTVLFDTLRNHSLSIALNYTPTWVVNQRTISGGGADQNRRNSAYRHPVNIQLDYQNPIVKYNLIPQFGANYSFETTRDSLTVNGLLTDNQSFNHIVNFYGQLGYQHKAFYAEVGVNVEGIYRFYSWQDPFSLWNFLPKARLNYTYGQHTFALAYNFLVDLPPIKWLNPLRDYDAQTFIYTEGNPNLRTNYKNSLNASYSWNNLVFLSLQYDHQTAVAVQLIQPVIENGQEIFLQSPINLDPSHQLITSITIPYTYKKGSMQYILQWTQEWMRTPLLPFYRNGFYGFTQQEYQFPKQWSSFVSYSYTSSLYDKITKQYDYHLLSFGVTKRWKRFRLSLEFQDVIGKRQRSRTFNNVLTTYRETYDDGRQIRLNLYWQIWGATKNEPKSDKMKLPKRSLDL